MGKTIRLVIVLTAIAFAANAQTVRLVRREFVKYGGKVNLDSTSVVKDSTGRIIPYKEWQPIVASGRYRLRFTRYPDSSMVFTILPFSKAENETRFASMPKPPESIFFKTGEKIPSFVAEDINGHGIRLKKLLGKVVVLNFWFIGCPPCRMEIPELNKVALAYANDPNVVFISIGLDYKDDIKNFLKSSPLAYHIIDNGRMYADLYKINLYPTNVVLDKAGKVQFHASGYFPNLTYWIKKTIDENK